MTNDQAYYGRRAEQQLKLAQQATDRSVCNAHYRLANLYLQRVAGEPQQGPRGR